VSVKALKRKAVSAISVSWSFGWVVCANRKLTLCTQDVQTENIQSSAVMAGLFLYMQVEENMDKLQERAFSFKKLINYEYKIILGRKGKKTELVISFEKIDFPHLIGLHKLTDVLNGNIATEKLFDDCLTGKVSYDTISKSEFFQKLGNRFEYFDKLETMLDSNDIIFKCNTNNMATFSRIIADFELKNIYEKLIFYLFIEKRNYSEKQYCKSFIQESNIDYTYGQTKMTLLYKEKINKITGESEIQYDKLSNK